MVFVTTPEFSIWVAFAETRVHLKHLLGRIGFEYGFCGLNGVPFWDVDLEMNVVFAKAKFAILKTKVFQVVECLGAGVDVALFSEVSVSFMRRKHHGHPVVSCVSRWLFIASAVFYFHIVL